MDQKNYWSLFDIFKIGIGPSSSHTVGPMKAAAKFVKLASSQNLLIQATKIKIKLHGSLGATGKGHGTDKAVIAGLFGYETETVLPEDVGRVYEKTCQEGRLVLNQNEKTLPFCYREDIIFDTTPLDFHPNALSLSLYGQQDQILLERTYFSVGGGFIKEAGDCADSCDEEKSIPYPFESCKDLLSLANKHNKSFSDLILDNERVFRSTEDIFSGIEKLWSVMRKCIDDGCRTEGFLPGSLKVQRRAPALFKRLHEKNRGKKPVEFLETCDWINLYAFAVSEQNASGGRVVTSPTNGAAGIVPAVLAYCNDFLPDFNEKKRAHFFLTATAIAILFKKNASISGAEVGCQGEVGSACSMAAAGLCEIMGGTPKQVENAAEIAIEHNLGLTCDPVGGLVQIPCIERNAIASVKAINAARLAINGQGTHKVSLDDAIATMRETGKDMQSKYKETSEGGLAARFRRTINIVDC